MSKKEIHNQNQSGLLEKLQKVVEDFFVSPVVNSLKKEKTFEIALDTSKLIDSCMKMKSHVPNVEQLSKQIFTIITRVEKEPLWISKMNLSTRTVNQIYPKRQVYTATSQ